MRAWFLLGTALMLATPGQAEPLRNLGSWSAMRSNQLVGYGLVVGLAGTGDDSLPYATMGMKGAADRFGMTLPPGVNPALKNAAAVMVTADLPAFAKPGQRIDVTVSALGKAKSLAGGTLIMMPLRGADGQVYAMAQGNLAVGGLGAEGANGSKLMVNVPSAARIAGGASVERAPINDFTAAPQLRFHLHHADAATATAVATAINARAGRSLARAEDAVTIAIEAPSDAPTRIAMMGELEGVDVTTAPTAARVIVNARTGTVVINGAVRLRPAAVTHGSLTVKIEETPVFSQPTPLSRGGQTVATSDSRITANQARGPMTIVTGPDLGALVAALNGLDLPPADLVAVLDALHQAGALSGQLVII